MKFSYNWGLKDISFWAMVTFAAPIFAEEISLAPAVAPIEEEGKLTGFLKSIELSGFVDTYYSYSYSKPVDRRGSTAGFSQDGGHFLNEKGFDREDNSFSLDNVEISVFKPTTEKDPIGFGFTTNYGEIAQRLTFVNSHGRADGLGGAQDFTISQGFVTYKAPIGKGLDFKVGKFATWIGAELWESVDNPNYSRSLIYQNTNAFTNTGIAMSYPVLDNLTASLFFVNGWDTFVDNNSGKTVGYQFNWKIGQKTNLIFNGSEGPEQARDSHSYRHFWEVIFAFKPLDKTTINIDADWATEQGASQNLNSVILLNNNDPVTSVAYWDKDGNFHPSLGNPGNAKWGGVSTIINQEITDYFGIAVRGEYLYDKDGARLGVQGLDVLEGTLTFNCKIRENLLIRPEVRYDKANKNVWEGKNNNLTTLIGFSYLF